MNDLSPCGTLIGDEPVASRREIVAAALTMAVAAGAAGRRCLGRGFP
jgi:hypothetical protein